MLLIDLNRLKLPPQFRCKIVKKSSDTIMEMAFCEQLSHRKYLKNCVLKLWFKDSGGTTAKKSKTM